MTANQRAVTYALIAVLLWSTVATAFKITLQHMTPLMMVAIASTVSWLALLALTWQQKKWALLLPIWRERPWFFISLGLLNPAVYYLVLFEAYARLPASQAQPLNYTWAIALTFLAAVILKQRIRRRDWVAAVLGYIGVFVIATGGDISGFNFDSPVGVGLALLSTFLWAAYWILNTRHKADPVVCLTLGFTMAVPLLVVAAISVEGLAAFSDISWRGWLAVSYVGLFEMGITFFFWLKAMREATNVALISNLIFISPFISLLLLATIIGESIYPSTIIGLLMIVIGLLVQRVAPSSFLPPNRWRRGKTDFR